MVDRDRHKGVMKPVGADPGFFLRGGAPQRNGVYLTGDVKNFNREYEEEGFSLGNNIM